MTIGQRLRKLNEKGKRKSAKSKRKIKRKTVIYLLTTRFSRTSKTMKFQSKTKTWKWTCKRLNQVRSSVQNASEDSVKELMNKKRVVQWLKTRRCRVPMTLTKMNSEKPK